MLLKVSLGPNKTIKNTKSQESPSILGHLNQRHAVSNRSGVAGGAGSAADTSTSHRHTQVGIALEDHRSPCSAGERCIREHSAGSGAHRGAGSGQINEGVAGIDGQGLSGGFSGGSAGVAKDVGAGVGTWARVAGVPAMRTLSASTAFLL